MKFRSHVSKIPSGAIALLVAVMAIVLFSSSPARAATGRITNFDPPGSVNSSPAAINLGGVIVGTFTDTQNLRHGFMRDAAGVITVLDAPGAGTAGGQGTSAFSINDLGQIVGQFTDSLNFIHGFLLNSPGAYTTIDDPDAQQTLPFGINNAGQIAGVLRKNKGATFPGFVRDALGNFTLFAGAGTCGTSVANAFINAAGQIAGTCIFSDGTYQIFFRTVGGAITPQSDPFGGTLILATAISDKGLIVGYYTAADGGFHAFYRDTFGGIYNADYPGSVSSVATGINVGGTLTGYYFGVDGIFHGYTRSSSATFVSFDDPSAGTRENQGTFPSAINGAGGQITGTYDGLKRQYHGFIRK